MREQNLNSTVINGLSALVADRNAIEANLLKIFLSRVCNNVLDVHSGQATVDAVVRSLASQSPFDVVVLSNKLQDSNGIETTRLLRSSGFTGPIVGTSTNISPTIKQQWSEAGCTTFLEKPISNAAITEMVVHLAKQP